MRITSIFLFTIIIFGGLSCSNDDSLIHNKTKGILEKYPEPTVTITAHNHIPFLAKNILEEKGQINTESFEEKDLEEQLQPDRMKW